MRNPLTKNAFAKWAASQPADADYYPGLRASCALCQYLRASGHPNAEVDNEWLTRNPAGPDEIPLKPFFNDVVYAKPWTFGALATRLRA